MEKTQAEKNAQFLADDYKQQLQEILERTPIENLEEIKSNISSDKNSPLFLLIQDILQALKNFDERNNDENKWLHFEGSLWHDVNRFQQVMLQHFFAYNILQAFLVSPHTPLNETYRENLLKKHKLTPKKLKDSLLTFLGDKSFLGEIKHGGSIGFWNDNNRLEFLALYNRFLIVIKNARKDVKQLIKKGNSELSAKKEILDKYEIPQKFIKSAFSAYDAPKEVALDWAKQEMKLESSEEYLIDILTEARKLWRVNSKGLISQPTLEQNPKIQLILIDINFELGCRRYAVSSINKKDMARLKYGTVAKKLNGKYERRTDEKPEEFLIWASF